MVVHIQYTKDKFKLGRQQWAQIIYWYTPSPSSSNFPNKKPIQTAAKYENTLNKKMLNHILLSFGKLRANLQKPTGFCEALKGRWF